MRSAHTPSPRTQTGVALAISLVMLVVILLIAMSAMRFTTTELRIAANEQIRVTVQQTAQSIVDAAASNSANTPVIGDIGYRVCSQAVSDCDANTVVLPNDFLKEELAAGEATVVVERLSPLLGPPPRGLGTSLAKFNAAYFQVSGSFDQVDKGQGRSAINEGVVVLVPTN